MSSSEDDDNITFVDNKGGKIALYGDYQYHLVRTYKSGASILRCSKYRKTNCRGSITLKDIKVQHSKEHSCVVDKSRNIYLKKKAEIKELVKKSDEPVPQLYKESIVDMLDMGLDLVDSVPSFSGMKTELYNTRNKSVGAKKTVFKKLEEVEIPLRFKAFVLAEYTCDDTRIFIFCTEESKLLIPTINEAFIDSTFKSCPKPFTQLLSIHGDLGSTAEKTVVRPLIFAVMSNKKQSSYVALLSIIKRRVGWNVTKIHCDYEIAFINAVTKVFPNTTIVGCYYHWMRNVWKKAKKLRHHTKVENRIIGMCAVLPLLPPGAIVEGWAYIKSEYDNANLKMSKFINYIERYMRNKNSVPMMSVFGERHRTNNVVESWHSTLNKRLNKNTVTLLRLLNVLKSIDKYNVAAKHECSKARKHEYVIRDDFIRNIQLQYLNGVITLGHALEKLR